MEFRCVYERSVSKVHFTVLLCSVNICFTSTCYRIAKFHSNFVVQECFRRVFYTVVSIFSLCLCVSLSVCQRVSLSHFVLSNNLASFIWLLCEEACLCVALVIPKVVGNPWKMSKIATKCKWQGKKACSSACLDAATLILHTFPPSEVERGVFFCF